MSSSCFAPSPLWGEGWGEGLFDCYNFCSAPVGRVSARRPTHFLLLRQKKVSKEKATLLFATLRFAAGNLGKAAKRGKSANSLRSNTRPSDPRFAALPRRNQKGLCGEKRQNLIQGVQQQLLPQTLSLGLKSKVFDLLKRQLGLKTGNLQKNSGFHVPKIG